MIAIFLAPFYILLNLYLARWVLRWMGACHHLCGTKAFRVVFIVVYALIASAPLTGFLIQSPYPLRQFCGKWVTTGLAGCCIWCWLCWWSN